MNDTCGVGKWYALFVVTGEEENIKERLRYRFEKKFKILVPKRKLKERKAGNWEYKIRTLFPGYIFVNGNMNISDYYDMRDVPGIIKLLGSGTEPMEIPKNEIEVVSRLICNNEIIGFSNVLVENGKVEVIDGPLESLEGYIKSIDRRKGRAKVRLSFLGEERTVELGVSVLKVLKV